MTIIHNRRNSINACVHQGSVLGTTLFVLNINHLFPAIFNCIHSYADDRTVLGIICICQQISKKFWSGLQKISYTLSNPKLRLVYCQTKIPKYSRRGHEWHCFRRQEIPELCSKSTWTDMITWLPKRLLQQETWIPLSS